MAQMDLKHAVISIIGGGVDEEIAVKIGDGTLTWSEKRNIEYVRDRGILDGTREGDQEPVDVRFDFTWEELRGAAAVVGPPAVDAVITPYEALTKTGNASGWTSSSADPCEPYAIDLQIVHTPPCGSVNVETILFSDFRYESIDPDAKAGTISVTGKANITRPTITQA